MIVIYKHITGSQAESDQAHPSNSTMSVMIRPLYYPEDDEHEEFTLPDATIAFRLPTADWCECRCAVMRDMMPQLQGLSVKFYIYRKLLFYRKLTVKLQRPT